MPALACGGLAEEIERFAVIHIGASRKALLTWLWRQKHEKSSDVRMANVLDRPQ
ncbi:hypothetical protein ABT173_45675 [Streptomyces sp. NPDC001795]|uniref:hypothetical protein n=1 Tax=Streptomyces sp. NPDC001795 TaxID=3154525 RepID=UPI00331EF0CC